MTPYILAASFACEVVFGSCLIVYAPAFAIARSRLTIKTLKYKSRTRNAFLQLRLKNPKFQTRSSTRRAFAQLRLENRNF